MGLDDIQSLRLFQQKELAKSMQLLIMIRLPLFWPESGPNTTLAVFSLTSVINVQATQRIEQY